MNCTQKQFVPLFGLGHIVGTPGAIDALKEADVNPLTLLNRHVTGDWGDLGEDDKRANEVALMDGSRVFSGYDLPTGETVWIITEWDRSATTLLLPSEY